MRPKGRRRVDGRRTNDGWVLEASQPVDDAAAMLPDVRARASGQPALFGIDAPIGVPAAWAARVGVRDFKALLPKLGRGRWRDFFDVADAKTDISPTRPFFPNRPGGAKRDDLVLGLGLEAFSDLMRRCDVAGAGRPANPLFWTLGGAQVGKAALSFWREALQAACADAATDIWPFDGAIRGLAREGGLTVAETYPAEVGAWFDLEIGKAGRSKRRQADRARAAHGVFAAGARMAVGFTPEAEVEITGGFALSGEDGFDAMVGALGLIAVADGHRPADPPSDYESLRVEGWILGRQE